MNGARVRIVQGIAAALTVLVVGACGAHLQDLTWSEVETAMGEGAVLVDARRAASYEKGHISGAVSVPYASGDEAYGQLAEDRGTTLIFYCGGPSCPLSRKGAAKAKALGYAKVATYEAGYPDWKKRISSP